MSFLSGGGASKDAAKSRAMQQIANDRQLAALQRDEQKNAPSRRAPRGQRLFSTASALSPILPGNLNSTLGG